VGDTIQRRKPDFGPDKASGSGYVTRDERDNAVWQWAGEREQLAGNFSHLGLSLEGGAALPEGPGRSPATIPGVNPYRRDRIDKPRRGRPRDLRALSRHIEQQRKRGKGEDC
jgi:hypothetical protein